MPSIVIIIIIILFMLLGINMFGTHLKDQLWTTFLHVWKNVRENLLFFWLGAFFATLQTLALWLRNTNYTKEQPKVCSVGIKATVDKFKLKLFRRKTVYDILWGYQDEFLKFLLKISKLTGCPAREGITTFIQLQVKKHART